MGYIHKKYSMKISCFTILMLLGLLIPSTIQAQYCSSRGYNASPRYIQEVEFGENIHVTGNNGGYLDFTSPKFVVLPGECAHLQLGSGSSDGNSTPFYTRVWIDYNIDGDFDDPGELIYSSSSFYVLNHQRIDIPASATMGLTKMRVSFKPVDGSPQGPCDHFYYGEVEDHTVEIFQSEPYCDNAGNSTYYEWIENVGTPGYYSNPASGDNGGYANFTCGPTIAQHMFFFQGSTNTIRMMPGYRSYAYPESWQVWIDYNENFSFEPWELVYSVSGVTGEVVGTITVPDFGQKILTRARVQMKYGAPPSNACGNYTWGEVEDFLAILYWFPPGPAPVTDPPMALHHHHEFEEREMVTQTPVRLPDEVFQVRHLIGSKTLSVDVGLRDAEVASIEIYDLQGRMVQQADWNGQPEQVLNLSNISSGLHVVSLRTNYAVVSRKIIL